MKPKYLYPILAVIAITVLIGAAAAVVYLYPASNTTQIIGVTPSPTPTEAPVSVTTTLTPSAPQIAVGQPAILTAQLSLAQQGKTVNFYEGTSTSTGVFLGSGVTDTLGKATFLINAVTEGTHTYIAQPIS